MSQVNKLTQTQQRVLRDFEEAVLQMAHLSAATMDEREGIKYYYDKKKALLIKHLAK